MTMRWCLAAVWGLVGSLALGQGIYQVAEGRRVEGRLEGRGKNAALVTTYGTWRGGGAFRAPPASISQGIRRGDP